MNNQHHTLSSTLLGLFRTEIDQAEQLLAILEQEKRAILNNIEELPALLESKQALIETLNATADEQNQLVLGAGFSADTIGLEQCVASCENAEQLTQEWNTLKEKLGLCQDNNLINGAIMEVNKIRIRQILSLLLGNDDAQIYDAAGKNQSGTSGKQGSVSVKA